MSRRNRVQKTKTKSGQQLVKKTQNAQNTPDFAAHILPGVMPVSERIQQITTTQHSSFDGPIPHPDIFRQYGEVIPDAPERILRVFEEDSEHIRIIQMEALKAQKSDNQRIHWMAWSLIAGGYAMSIVFALFNKDILAGAVLTTTIVGTVTGFLQNQTKKPDDKD